jgi:hypothetical protein
MRFTVKLRGHKKEGSFPDHLDMDTHVICLLRGYGKQIFITIRLSENTCYFSVLNLLSSRLQSKHVKIPNRNLCLLLCMDVKLGLRLKEKPGA